MILNKTRKVCLFIIGICLAVIMLSGFVIRERQDWTDKQNGAHAIAEIAREIGLPDDDPIILRAQVIWWQEEASKGNNYREQETRNPEPVETFEAASPVETPAVVNTNIATQEDVTEVTDPEPEVIVSEDVETVEETKPIRYTLGVPGYTQEDIDRVASVIYNEGAFGTTERHKELIAAALVNRVSSPWLGDNVYDVICWPSQYLPAYAQYGSWYMNRAMESEDWPYLCEIAERALRGEIDVPYDMIFQAEFVQGRGIYEVCNTDYSTTYFCLSLYTYDDPLEVARANGLVD